jgi:hypothetical protein
VRLGCRVMASGASRGAASGLKLLVYGCLKLRVCEAFQSRSVHKRA